MKIPSLKIGDALVQHPIIQGGMAIGVSTSELAVAVAEPLERGFGLTLGNAQRVSTRLYI